MLLSPARGRARRKAGPYRCRATQASDRWHPDGRTTGRAFRHAAIREQRRAGALVGLEESLLEGQIVAIFAKEGVPADGPVEDVVNDPSGGDAKTPCHGRKG